MRSMLCVPYFEKALYEMDEEAVTPASIQQLADQVTATTSNNYNHLEPLQPSHLEPLQLHI